MVLNGILIAYAFLGCIYWLWMLVGTVRIVRAVPLLEQVRPPQPEIWPRLSLVIPACNEAETLESALRSVLQQDYPDVEVILIDDRSTDGTGQIVDRMAAEDERIRAFHVELLPDGWLGKVHALSLGSEKATGSWLLFADADVHMSQGALRRSVSYALEQKLDHLAALPDIWPTSLVVDASVALFCRIFLVALRLWAVGDPKSRAFVGVGAFNLVRREALRQTEGFAWLRMEVGDDVGLGMMLKQSGAACGLVNAHGLLGLQWYGNLTEMARGAEKAYSSAARCSLLRIVVMCAALIALEWAPWVAFASWRIPGLMWSGVAMLLAAATSSIILARWTRASFLPGLFAPFAAWIASAIMMRSGYLGHQRGGIVWRGTLYPKAELLAGRRLTIP